MNDKTQINEYRLELLDKRVDSLTNDISITKDAVLRIDAKLSNIAVPLPCLLHNQRIETLENSLTELSSVTAELKTFKTQVLVYGSVIVFLINIVGPMIVDRIWPKGEVVTIGAVEFTSPTTNNVYSWR